MKDRDLVKCYLPSGKRTGWKDSFRSEIVCICQDHWNSWPLFSLLEDRVLKKGLHLHEDFQSATLEEHKWIRNIFYASNLSSFHSLCILILSICHFNAVSLCPTKTHFIISFFFFSFMIMCLQTGRGSFKNGI